MGEFFKGWKRKVGCVTLVMACVFAAGWVRSQNYEDDFTIHQGTTHDHVVVSDSFGLALFKIELFGDGPLIGDGQLNREFYRTQKTTGHYPTDIVDFDWQRQWGGFFIGKGFAKESSGGFEVCIIPYWSIFIALTLLSAYLLVSKPRPAKTTVK